ncbi:AAA domain-containing protein [Spiroplasma diminutum]|uniref:Superfamily I DNA/RNA helicase n=1 Tax=Spiroplasma diminutum CUAS-1 TaxID=1276221 RepID=S5MIT8_9MOLU|nr:AAA domain-containing protein [Spiroplasma diminutum]AGR41845.1 superfamily I DNA/RNA helicase [Spiroplasma diminutum CUAS-1]
MSNIIENNGTKEIILDFSFLQNVQFKENPATLDQIIEQLDIKGVKTCQEFQNFLKNSLAKKSFICLLDDKTHQFSKKDKSKTAYNGIIRMELDSKNQSLLPEGTYLGFYVNIDTKNAGLTISSIFMTRLKSAAQEFETIIKESHILIIRNQGQIKDDEIIRRNVLNSSNIGEIGRLLSTFEEEKEKWLNFLEFSENLLKLERKKSLPYLGVSILKVIKIDKIHFNNHLIQLEVKELKSKTFKYLFSNSENILRSNDIPFEFSNIITLDLLVDDLEKVNKIKKTKELSLVPIKMNKNIITTHDLIKNIHDIFDFNFERTNDFKNVINLGTMLGTSDEEMNFQTYWIKNNKTIFLGENKELEYLLKKNPNEMQEWKIKKMSFEIEQDFDQAIFNLQNNIDSLATGYIAYTGIGEDVLIERYKQVIKKISDGNTKNPYLVNYLFNTRLVELSELSDDISIEDKDFEFNLNSEQKEAVRKAINTKDIFILQGPPGTGKTQVICEIINQLSKLNRKILLSSQNHEAIKNVVDRLPIDPNLNKIRLTNQINLKTQVSNNYSPDRVLYNYYKAIGKRAFDDMKNDESSIKEFQDYKNNLEQLINANKSFHQNNSQIREIQDKINNLNEKIVSLKQNNLDKIKHKNYLKEELINIENLIEALNTKEFEAIINVSDKLLDCYKQSIEFDLNNFVYTYLNFEPSDFSNIYLLIKEIANEIYFKNNIFLEIKDSKNNVNKYKRTAEFELAEKEESKILGLEQLLKTDLKLNELNKIFDFFTLSLKNLKLEIEIDLQKENENQYSDVELSTFEIHKNELTVTKNNLSENAGSNSKELRELIKIVNNKFNLNLGLTDIDLEEQVKVELSNLENKLKNSKERKENFSEIYTQLITYLNNNYKITSNFEEELASKDFSGQMFKDSQRYIQTILDNLVNVYSMTLTSTNLFKFNKDNFASKLGLEELNLRNMDVDVVIIDEASKATILEILMPLIYGKSLILVGDYRQLPPILKLQPGDVDEVNKYFNKDYNYNLMYELLDESAFKKLISAKNKSITSILKTQYRSHEQIMEIVNKFYDGYLKVEPQVSDQKRHDLVITNANHKEIINSRSSVYWVDSTYNTNDEINYEQGEDFSTSLFNELEISLTKKLLEKIDKEVLNKKSKLRPSVAIISFYGLHVNKLKREIKISKFKNIDITINTVDDFQGKEADYVLVNMVRNPEKLSTKSGRDFLKKYERINVAFSRARELLIIIGAQRAVTDITVKIPTIEDPNVSNSHQVYADIISKLDFENCLLEAKEIMEE